MIGSFICCIFLAAFTCMLQVIWHSHLIRNGKMTQGIKAKWLFARLLLMIGIGMVMLTQRYEPLVVAIATVGLWLGYTAMFNVLINMEMDMHRFYIGASSRFDLFLLRIAYGLLHGKSLKNEDMAQYHYRKYGSDLAWKEKVHMVGSFMYSIEMIILFASVIFVVYKS